MGQKRLLPGDGKLDLLDATPEMLVDVAGISDAIAKKVVEGLTPEITNWEAVNAIKGVGESTVKTLQEFFTLKVGESTE